MKIFIVYWHAEEKSFNHAMLETAVATLHQCGHAVQVSDLNKMKFNPVVSRKSFNSVRNSQVFDPVQEALYAAKNDSFADVISSEMAKIFWCDLLIFQFPLWWSRPALLLLWPTAIPSNGFLYSHSCYSYSPLFTLRSDLFKMKPECHHCFA